MSSFIYFNSREASAETKYSAEVIKNALLKAETKSSAKADSLVKDIKQPVALNEALVFFTDKLGAIKQLSQSIIEVNEGIVEAEVQIYEAARVPSNVLDFAKRKGSYATSLVKKAATWAEKAGKYISGGTAIGKDYMTIILDMKHQGSEIYINLNDETIELFGEEVTDAKSFQKVLDTNMSESKANESQENDVLASVKAIRDFNRSSRGAGDINQLAVDIIKNLGFRAVDPNVTNTIEHLANSTDRNEKIPEDQTLVRELYSILESKANEGKKTQTLEVVYQGPIKKYRGDLFKARKEDNGTYTVFLDEPGREIVEVPASDVRLVESKVNEGAMSDIDIIAQEAKDFKSFVKEFKKEYKNMDAGNPKELEAWLQSVYDAAKENMDESLVTESVTEAKYKPAGLTKEETLKVAETYAKAISKLDGVKCTVNMKTLEEDSFDLDLPGDEYAGGSYSIDADDNVYNDAMGTGMKTPPIYGKSNDSVDAIVKTIKKLNEAKVTEGKSINKIQKDWSQTTTAMSQKVDQWKSAEGDRKIELLDELKALTAKKRALESELDAAVAGKDKDLELVVSEGNAFGAARAEAIAKGEKEFTVDGETYPVESVDDKDKTNAEEFVKESKNDLWNYLIEKHAINEDLRTDIKKYIKSNKKEIDAMADQDNWEGIYSMLMKDFEVREDDVKMADEIKTIFNIVY